MLASPPPLLEYVAFRAISFVSMRSHIQEAIDEKKRAEATLAEARDAEEAKLAAPAEAAHDHIQFRMMRTHRDVGNLPMPLRLAGPQTRFLTHGKCWSPTTPRRSLV